MSKYLSIIRSINSANISASAIRTALILAEAVDPDSDAMATFDWPVICTKLGAQRPLSRGRVRSILIELSQANLIDYHTNSMVMVRFSNAVRAESDQERADNDHVNLPRAESDQIRADSDQIRADSDHDAEATDATRAESDQERADNDHVNSPRADSDQIRADSDQIRADSDHTNYVVSQSVSTLSDPDQLTDRRAKTRAMLTDADIGMAVDECTRYLNSEPEWLLRQIFAWRRDRQSGKVEGLGALHHRLQRRWGAPALTEQEKRTGYYRRHFGAEEEISLDGTTASQRRSDYAIHTGAIP